ncbi:MAG: hypothetical protein K0Q90_628 [Paenibacillaceae bacterium]|jgi:GNAT superfamily N-acetyltransferase|nr:hypothetical protein [Paenibacillaceae bacterium]
MEIRVERIGTEEKTEQFLALLQEIALWLEEIGQPMWSLEGLEKERFLAENSDAELYLCYCGEEPAGAFMLKSHNEFWWPESREGDDLFLKKLGVSRSYAGTGLSGRILEWVKLEAERRGIKHVRIEFYADREHLIKLYRKNGFEEVRRRVMPDGIEIALCQYAAGTEGAEL